jgi:outer membrane murein-binding lipoprotein Lpp
MSKKIFILSIFALLTVLLCGCGNNSKKKNLADVDSNDPIVTQ